MVQSNQLRVYLGVAFRKWPISLQTPNLKHPRTSDGDTLEDLLLVVLVLGSCRYYPWTVGAAFRALLGEPGTVGARGGVEAFKPLRLDAFFRLLEMYNARELNGGGR